MGICFVRSVHTILVLNTNTKLNTKLNTKERIVKYICIWAVLAIFPNMVMAGQQMTVSEYIAYISPKLSTPVTVGFDLDDTLLDNQPSWIAAATAQKGKIFTPAFWAELNSSSCVNDAVKTKVKQIVDWHKSQGHKIVVITARHSSPNHIVDTCLQNLYGYALPVIFAPDGKTEALTDNAVQVFYGDSDSDIKYALQAHAIPVRIIRSKRSINPSPIHIGETEIVILQSDTF